MYCDASHHLNFDHHSHILSYCICLRVATGGMLTMYWKTGHALEEADVGFPFCVIAMRQVNLARVEDSLSL